MALQSFGGFNVVTTVGIDEIGTYQEKNYICAFQVLVNGRLPFVAGANPTIMPCLDDAQPLERGEMYIKAIPNCLVGVRVAVKQRYGS